jgi:ankyrin repeat protein
MYTKDDLFDAIYSDNLPLFKKIIRAQNDLANEFKDRDTMLQWCIFYNRAEMVDFLLNETKVNIKALGSGNENAFDKAMIIRQSRISPPHDTTIIRLLLQRRVHVNLERKPNALDIAVEKGDDEVVSLILKYVPLEQFHLNNALFYACRNGKKSMFHFLHMSGVDIKSEELLLHKLCNNPNAEADAVTYLINIGYEINKKDILGNTPLHLAATSGNSIAINVLLERKAQVNVFNKKYETPLIVAVRHGHLQASVFLIAKQANLEVKTNNGGTLLHMATENNKCSELILFFGNMRKEWINMGDKYGRTPLHYACYYNSLAAVKGLLQLGANPNIKCKDGDTPIFYILNNTYFAQQWEMYVELVYAGLDLSITDKNNHKISDYSSPARNFLLEVESLISEKTTKHKCSKEIPSLKSFAAKVMLEKRSKQEYEYELAKHEHLLGTNNKFTKNLTDYLEDRIPNKHISYPTKSEINPIVSRIEEKKRLTKYEVNKWKRPFII